MNRRPTISDVASEASVSRQTVSNVLNTPEIVKPATRERVLAVIERLGYQTNAGARRLRTRRSSTIGIRLETLPEGVVGGVLDRFLHALTEKADTLGMRMMLFTANSPNDEIEKIRALRARADIDGVVLTSTFHGDPRTQWLLRNEVPFVTFGRPWGTDDINNPIHRWVDVDGAAGVRDATRYLLTVGHSRIAFLGWPSPSGTGDDRRSGWAQAMLERSGAPHASADEILHFHAEEKVHDAELATQLMLAQHPEIDAIVCASDALATGARIATAMADRAEIAVIGFDNSSVATAIGLSSVDQRLDLVAGAVLELLLEAIDPSTTEGGEPAEVGRLVTPRLIPRRPTSMNPSWSEEVS
jgi:DNA-binding LacI/PurR family transcriptional regulator